MFVKNERGDYRSLHGVDVIGVGSVDETETGGTVRWTVFLDHNTPVNRVGRYDDERAARGAAEWLAHQVGVVEVDDGPDTDSANPQA
jgi:hypothetical protein